MNKDTAGGDDMARGGEPELDLRLARKRFLGASALAASAAALAACRPPMRSLRERKLGKLVYPVLTPKQYDYAGMMKTLRVATPHKQLFPATAAAVQPQTDIATLYLHMQFAMNGLEFSLPGTPGRLATLGVLSGSSVVFALNDAMWRSYGLGDRFALAPTNIYYPATSNLDASASPNDPHGLYQDWSAQAVIKRGGAFMVCHNALTYFAVDCAIRKRGDARAVMEDWLGNLLPGFSIVPSGITAIYLAAENGWQIYPAV
ncbi:MAG: hypothetical protein JO098_08095 [Candidatus Eremiobacteraeota bacterium]|nr:hypothetical protein [Candidatus Eremiobacteraeota bacterium]